MFVRSIARGSSYRIRSFWINAHNYILSFQIFFLRGVGDGGGGRERGVEFYEERGG